MNKKKQLLLLDLRKMEDSQLKKFIDYIYSKHINWIWLDDYKKRKQFYSKK